jgi:hypothetical protein|eukprot:COSAG01_NODE_8104_length_2919_cov_7.235106_2_plen_55_part_00
MAHTATQGTERGERAPVLSDDIHHVLPHVWPFLFNERFPDLLVRLSERCLVLLL